MIAPCSCHRTCCTCSKDDRQRAEPGRYPPRALEAASSPSELLLLGAPDMSAISTFALDIEHVSTDDDPITGLPWPPPEPGAWVLVCRRPADHTTVWRRIACREADRG